MLVGKEYIAVFLGEKSHLFIEFDVEWPPK